ncbi:PAS domain-containing sensor histidine kinase [Pedobacter yonginense]|uniref:histidine kinase n=1 Tax=Pedobacter yonginense TaxID=651869 RepID=A0A317EMQ7_9SPHI|nr:PAS domain-containing sensor histidine kinase [Pedobacter yonginense]PWS26328.1 PAS domain-containing sensor histidine kinase [Pedobacter yonginense]
MDILNKFDNGEFAFSKDDIKADFKLLTRALDASYSGIIITDNLLPDNPIIYCNEAFEKMSGYRRSEIIGHNCRFLQGADRSQRARAIIREAVANGEVCTVDIRNYRKNGDLFWNELFISPIVGDDGKVTNFIGVQNDITRRKKSEQDLRAQKDLMEKQVLERTKDLKESQEFLYSIIQTVRESLIVIDPDFKVVSANDHFLKTFKVSLEETVGTGLYELGNHQWDIPQLRKLLTDILPTNNPVEDFEVEHDFPHIGRKLMLLNAHRIELEGQYKDQILLAIEDITERREIERRKDDFLSIASHELKTPLTTIKGYVQAMERMVPKDSGARFLGFLSKTAKYLDRLNNLIAELLDVSRIQTGNLKLHKVPFDFDKMVKETVEAIQTATQNHNIIIEGFSGVQVPADESHIAQVLTNLLSNAIKYAPESGQVHVYISKVSNYVKLSVTDSGIGISPEDQKKIFERFYRAGDIQQRFPGMGIGLYICEQIIKNHDGTLWVESEKEKGSTFSFTLPIQAKEDNEQ